MKDSDLDITKILQFLSEHTHPMENKPNEFGCSRRYCHWCGATNAVSQVKDLKQKINRKISDVIPSFNTGIKNNNNNLVGIYSPHAKYLFAILFRTDSKRKRVSRQNCDPGKIGVVNIFRFLYYSRHFPYGKCHGRG